MGNLQPGEGAFYVENRIFLKDCIAWVNGSAVLVTLDSHVAGPSGGACVPEDGARKTPVCCIPRDSGFL